MRLPQYHIILNDVREGLKQIPDNSVDVIVSSPPYFAQRSYHAGDKEIGHEPTSQGFVDSLVDIFYNHCWRVLKPHGLIFLNLGDSYNGSGGQGSQGGPEKGVLSKSDESYKPRDLLNVPHRVYEGLRAKGYYWRSTVIFSKTNGMPESVKGVRWERHKVKVRDIPVEETIWKKDKIAGQEGSSAGNHHEVEWADCPGCDKCSPHEGYVLRWGSGRPTSKYETIGILTKENYYWDTEAVRTPYAESSKRNHDYPVGSFGGGTDGNRMTKEVDKPALTNFFIGANLGNIWEMPTAMFSEKHFATFPEELPELCIKAGSSEFGCCSECGKPYARVVERVVGEERPERFEDGSGYDNRRKPTDIFAQSTSTTLRTIGWRPTCSHKDAEVVPSVVLDPFAGACTTLLVANRLNRDAIGIELNEDYIGIGEKRVYEDAPLFNYVQSTF